MSRAKRIEPVKGIAENAERQLAVSLVACEQRVSEAQAKLLELERYRQEYQQQFTQRVGGGMGVTNLRDYQAFIARLGEAVRQQQAIVQRACAQRDAERRRWQDAARKSRAIGHVISKWQADEQRIQEQHEQRSSDERAQRRRSDGVME